MTADATRSTDAHRVALVARALAAGVSVTDLLAILARQSVEGLGADGAVLGAVDDVRGVVSPRAVYGSARANLDRLGPLLLDAELPLTVASRTGEAVWVTSRADARARFPRMATAFPEAHSCAAIPLVAGGRPIGALGLTFDQAHDFDDAQRTFLSTLADLCTVALVARNGETSSRDEGVPSIAPVVGDGVQIAERLHAVLIRDLFAATLSLGAVASLVDGPTRDRLIAVIEQHDAIIREVRQAIIAT